MELIGWDDFTRVELRVGRIVAAEVFAQARKPAYLLQVDFGPRSASASPAPRSPTTTTPKA